MSRMQARMIYLHALTAVHAGTGQAAAVIDLPVAREKATGWPVIPASTLKGVLRDALDDGRNGDWVRTAFGPPVDRAADHAGGLRFGDQRLLCLPARSFFGTFAWTTCPLALSRLVRDARAIGLSPPFEGDPPETTGLQARVVEGSPLAREGKVYLEDLDLQAQAAPAIETVAAGLAQALFELEEERAIFRDRFAIVSNEVFDFLCETGTEVAARVRLEDHTKTVTTGGLWYEEAVPAEAVFAGPVLSAPPSRQGAEALLEPLKDTLVQVGGKASVGKGLCRMRVRS